MAQDDRGLRAVEQLPLASCDNEALRDAPPGDGLELNLGDKQVLNAAGLASIQPLVDSMPYFVMLVDARHRILLVNTSIVRKMGRPATALIGAYCPKAIHGLDAPIPSCPLQEALAKGRDVEWDIEDPATGRWVSSGIFPTRYRTDDGESVFLHSVRDITEAKHAAMDLKRKARTHAALAALLHLSSTDLTLDGLLQRALDEILDIPWLSVDTKGAIFLMEDETQGLRMRAQRGLCHAVQDACTLVPLGHCLCGRAAASGKVEYAADLDHRHDVHYDGMAAHGHYCVPIRSEGRVCGVLTLYLRAGHREDAEEVAFLQAVADGLGGIVNRKLAEDRCTTARENLIQADRMATIGTLAAGVVHEIKNPLAYVIANVDYGVNQLRNLLAIGEGSAGRITDPCVRHQLTELHHALGDAMDGAERLRGIVRDMRTFSNMRNESTALLDINQVVESAINIAFAEIKPRARFTKNLPPLPAVAGNDGRLGQAFLNLLVNAAQAIPEGCPSENAIGVCTSVEAGEVVVRISDTGNGMAPAVQAHMFDAFFSTKDSKHGTGLGLWITRNIVIAHSGRIEVQSKLGEGTTFSVHLPIAQTPDEEKPGT